MHFKLLSAICFNLDQSKILLSGNGLSYFTKGYNFRSVKIESICRRQIKCAENMVNDSESIENFVGKGENASYQHFLLFSQGFQKVVSCGSLKPWIV